MDDKGYETADSVTLRGHTIHAGDRLACLCRYEIVRLHLVYDPSTKKIIEGHPNTSFSYRMHPSKTCPVHFMFEDAG